MASSIVETPPGLPSTSTSAFMAPPGVEDLARLGSLQADLEDIRKNFQDAAPEEMQEMLYEHMQKWKSSEVLQEALKEGDVAPDFHLPDQDGKMISLVDLRARGPVVVVFFRGNWCSFCNATLRMIRKYTPYFQARGATVVAISPQTVKQSKEIRKSAGLSFPVLSDQGSEYAQLLNIAYVVEDNVKKTIEGAMGMSFEEVNGENDYDSAILPIPATYVIETDGRVTYSFVDTDYTNRAEPLDVLNVLPPPKRRPSLRERIEVEMGRIRDTQPDERMRHLFDTVELLKSEGVEQRALQVGDRISDFRVKDRQGSWIDSKKIRRIGPMIVTFQYGHSLCNIQMASFQKYLSKMEAKGATLVSILSPSVPHFTSGVHFPVVHDTLDQSIANMFGVLVRLPSLIKEEATDLPMAATFVIDKSGTIVYSFVDVDPSKRAEPVDVLKAIPVEKQKVSKRGPFSLLFNGRLAKRFRRV